MRIFEDIIDNIDKNAMNREVISDDMFLSNELMDPFEKKEYFSMLLRFKCTKSRKYDYEFANKMREEIYAFLQNSICVELYSKIIIDAPESNTVKNEVDVIHIAQEEKDAELCVAMNFEFLNFD